MLVQKCLEAYTINKLNCAQSILTGFQLEHGVEATEIAEARKWGAGRAEHGVCGALHAALRLARDVETKKVLRQVFREQAGSEQCREIRALKRLGCAACVELAAATLAGQGHSHLP